MTLPFNTLAVNGNPFNIINDACRQKTKVMELQPVTVRKTQMLQA